MNAGWMVTVAADNGTLLYAARTDDPIEAEAIVRDLFKIPPEIDVSAHQPLPRDIIEDLKINQGEAKGPM